MIKAIVNIFIITLLLSYFILYPEQATMLLLGSGLICISVVGRKILFKK